MFPRRFTGCFKFLFSHGEHSPREIEAHNVSLGIYLMQFEGYIAGAGGHIENPQPLAF